MVAVRGKTVLVTGGRRGLGSALVDEMLARGAVKVYSTARESYSDNRERVISLPLEVRDEQSVAALADSASDVDIVLFTEPGQELEGKNRLARIGFEVKPKDDKEGVPWWHWKSLVNKTNKAA